MLSKTDISIRWKQTKTYIRYYTWVKKKTKTKLEQLEHLHSDDTSPPPPHDYPYYWVILDPKSKEDKVKVTNLKNSPKFHFFLNFETNLLKLLDKMWKYEMDLTSIVDVKIQSRNDSAHRRTDGQGETSLPPFQLHWSGGITTTITTKTMIPSQLNTSYLTSMERWRHHKFIWNMPEA